MRELRTVYDDDVTDGRWLAWPLLLSGLCLIAGFVALGFVVVR